MDTISKTSAKKKRSKKKAVIEAWCTGCGGAPVCMTSCKKGALTPVRDQDAYPFRRMTVNHDLCIGCGLCATSGTMGIRLAGCPWDAITMMTVDDTGETVRA